MKKSITLIKKYYNQNNENLLIFEVYNVTIQYQDLSDAEIKSIKFYLLIKSGHELFKHIENLIIIEVNSSNNESLNIIENNKNNNNDNE